MNKMIVAVFENERDAFNGLSALKELHKDGDITIFADVVLLKDSEGKVSAKDSSGNSVTGTALGFTVGALTGLLAGPLGFVLGGLGGSTIGLMYDLYNSGVDAGYIDDVSKAMENGTVSIVAEIDEEWIVPVDTKIDENNGILFRRLKNEVISDQIKRENEQSEKEIEYLRAEMSEAKDDAKANIQKHIDAAKAKLELMKTKVAEKNESIEKEYQEKSETIKNQIDTASDIHKAKLQKKLDELNATHEKNAAKLNASLTKIKETLNKDIF